MSMRVVMSGVAGSAAVLAITLTSLGPVRAQADAKPAPARPAASSPATLPTPKERDLGPAWLKRLLSRSDLERPPKRS